MNSWLPQLPVIYCTKQIALQNLLCPCLKVANGPHKIDVGRQVNISVVYSDNIYV